MKRLAVLSMFMAFSVILFLSGGNAAAEKAGGAEVFENLEFVPLSQWKDPLQKPIPPVIRFCGLEVSFEEKGDTLTLSHGEAKGTFTPSDKPGLFAFSEGGKSYSVGVFHTKGEGWKYFNAAVVKLKKGKYTIYGFDLNCDGEYFVPDIDGLIYPGSRCVVPCPAGKAWLEDSVARIVRNQGGYEMTIEKMKAPKQELKALIYINRFRVGAGLHPLFLDGVLSTACRQHAAYIAANGADQIDTPYKERPGAEGYSVEGARIAPSSLYYYFGDVETAVHVMLGHIFYRTYFVKANINEIGIGFADPISVFNVTKAADKVYDYMYPIMIPGPEQVIPYQSYYKSQATVNPDPRPGAAGCGFPVTLTWDWGEKPELVEAKLYFVTRKKEKPEQVSASGPNKPVTAFYTDNRNIIALIPLNPLKPKSRYHVVIKYKVNGREGTADWYFNTGKEED